MASSSSSVVSAPIAQPIPQLAQPIPQFHEMGNHLEDPIEFNRLQHPVLDKVCGHTFEKNWVDNQLLLGVVQTALNPQTRNAAALLCPLSGNPLITNLELRALVVNLPPPAPGDVRTLQQRVVALEAANDLVENGDPVEEVHRIFEEYERLETKVARVRNALFVTNHLLQDVIPVYNGLEAAFGCGEYGGGNGSGPLVAVPQEIYRDSLLPLGMHTQVIRARVEAEFSDRIASAETEAQRKTREVQDLNEEIDRLLNDSRTQSDECTRQTQRGNDLDRQYNAILVEYRALDTTHKTLSIAYTQLTVTNNTLRQENTQLRADHVVLRQANTQLTANCNIFMQANTQLANNNQQLQKQVDNVKAASFFALIFFRKDVLNPPAEKDRSFGQKFALRGIPSANQT